MSASEALQIGYNFDAQNGNPTQTDPSATLSVATLSGDFSDFNGSGNPGFAAFIGSEGGARMPTLEFTVTPNGQLSLTNFSYDVANSAFSIGVFSSADNFTSALNSYTPPTSSYTTRSFGLSSFNNISSPVTFRIQQPINTFITLDNVRLDFTLTAVPFEFSPAFGFGTLGALWAGRKILKNSLNKLKS